MSKNYYNLRGREPVCRRDCEHYGANSRMCLHPDNRYAAVSATYATACIPGLRQQRERQRTRADVAEADVRDMATQLGNLESRVVQALQILYRPEDSTRSLGLVNAVKRSEDERKAAETKLGKVRGWRHRGPNSGGLLKHLDAILDEKEGE